MIGPYLTEMLLNTPSAACGSGVDNQECDGNNHLATHVAITLRLSRPAGWPGGKRAADKGGDLEPA